MLSCQRTENYQRIFEFSYFKGYLHGELWINLKVALGCWFDIKALRAGSSLCVISCNQFGIYLNISKVNVSQSPCTCSWHGRVYIYTYSKPTSAWGTVKWAVWVGGTTLNLQYAHCTPLDFPFWPTLAFDLIITFSEMSFSPFQKLIWLPHLGSFRSVLPRGVGRKSQTHIYEEHKNYWHIWRSHKCSYT